MDSFKITCRVTHFTLNALRYFFPGIAAGLYLTCIQQIPKVELENLKPLLLYGLTTTASSLTAYVPVVYISLASCEAIFICSELLAAVLIFSFIIRNGNRWIEVRDNGVKYTAETILYLAKQMVPIDTLD